MNNSKSHHSSIPSLLSKQSAQFLQRAPVTGNHFTGETQAEKTAWLSSKIKLLAKDAEV